MLELGKKLLTFYEKYFGIKFPKYHVQLMMILRTTINYKNKIMI